MNTTMMHLVAVKKDHAICGEAMRGGRVNIRCGEYYVEVTKFQFHYQDGAEQALCFHGANWRDGDGTGDLMVRLSDFPALAGYPHKIETDALELVSKAV